MYTPYSDFHIVINSVISVKIHFTQMYLFNEQNGSVLRYNINIEFVGSCKKFAKIIMALRVLIDEMRNNMTCLLVT